MKCDTYEEQIPDYSLSYLFNNDASGLEDNDIKAIDNFMQYYYDLAKKRRTKY